MITFFFLKDYCQICIRVLLIFGGDFNTLITFRIMNIIHKSCNMIEVNLWKFLILLVIKSYLQ